MNILGLGLIAWVLFILTLALATVAVIVCVNVAIWKVLKPKVHQKSHNALVAAIREAQLPVDQTPPKLSQPQLEAERYGPQ